MASSEVLPAPRVWPTRARPPASPHTCTLVVDCSQFMASHLTDLERTLRGVDVLVDGVVLFHSSVFVLDVARRETQEVMRCDRFSLERWLVSRERLAAAHRKACKLTPEHLAWAMNEIKTHMTPESPVSWSAPALADVACGALAAKHVLLITASTYEHYGPKMWRPPELIRREIERCGPKPITAIGLGPHVSRTALETITGDGSKVVLFGSKAQTVETKKENA